LQRAKRKSDFFDRVFKIVSQIPAGKVTTYGAVAEACGVKSAARTVGWALHGTNGLGIPCHRVVNRNGDLTGKVHFGDIHMMEDLLRSEGVEFNRDGSVVIEKHMWMPPRFSRGHRAKRKVKPSAAKREKN
jgi:methylated-DNA-protein-cysteine methyltransferase related protein